MKTFLVTYDLRSSRDYEALYEALRSYSTRVRILESVWEVKTDGSAADVRDHLVRSLDSDDQIFVTRVVSGSAWRNLPAVVANWIKKQHGK